MCTSERLGPAQVCEQLQHPTLRQSLDTLLSRCVPMQSAVDAKACALQQATAQLQEATAQVAALSEQRGALQAELEAAQLQVCICVSVLCLCMCVHTCMQLRNVREAGGKRGGKA